MSTFLKDIKYSIRQLCKNPGFTVIMIMIVGLGIGANAAIFNVLSALMMRSLPVRNPQELRIINWEGNLTPSINWTSARNVFSYQTYQDFRDHGKGLTEVFALSDMSGYINDLNVSTGGLADTASGTMVSGNFFQGLGLDAFMGQTITPEHDRPEAEPITVISYAAWQRFFTGDPQTIGRTVTLNSHSFTIIGILPQGFKGLVPGESRDFYIPMSAHGLIRNGSAEETSYWWVQVMARLAPNADESRVRASLESLFARAVRNVPARDPQKTFRIELEDASCGLLASQRDLIKSLHMLLGLVGIVLLVTCLNLAGLLLARGARRQHDMAVRVALGAGRWILIRQLLTESILIVMAGAVLGLVLACWGKIALFHLLVAPGSVLDLHNDSRVLYFMLVVALATALLAGLLPAFRVTRACSAVSLRDRSSLGSPRLRLGRTLVSVQIGLSLVLLMGAGLFARTLINLYRVETGFNIKNLLVFEPGGLRNNYDWKQVKDFHERFSASLRTLPGVRDVGRSNFPLLSGKSNYIGIQLPNRSGSFVSKDVRVNSSFLTTLGIPLIMGRHFNTHDIETPESVVVVNQAFVRSAFPNEDPIDKTMRLDFGDGPKDHRIIGVCQDIKYDDIKKISEPILFRLDAIGSNCYMVRTATDAESLIPDIRKTLAAIDPSLPLRYIKTQSIQLDESIARERCFAALTIGMALLAVLLACMGLYGVMAYNVARRTSEIGIRMALGATSHNVYWSILRSALLMAGAGMTIAIPIALVMVRIVRSYLFGIAPHDPSTLVSAMTLLLFVTALAVWQPARRAAKIDPMEALRYE